MPLAEGTWLGPYQIVQPLGSGGMGEVYRAHDARLARDVAIKVLPSDLSGDPIRRQRFEREARAIAALNHPHICILHDIGDHAGVEYLVMELLDGEPLADRLARGPLPFDEAHRHATTILETLAVVHERGLVHRDLKPANIFLTRHGVKLLDFGLARDVRPASVDNTSVTQAGIVMGTPRYMAPEQLRGGITDPRTDLFAAAAVIYEMVAGRPPFDGSSVVDLMHAIAYEEPPALPHGTTPSAFERALRQGLSKDPEHRPANATVFAAALRRDASSQLTTEVMARSRGPVRLIVLPFRLLRPDPETDFLGFSLADAVATSLSGLDSIVVRSTLTAMQYASATDFRVLAEQAAVDVVLTGSLLRVGGEVRVSAQLVEVPQGSVVWSRTIQSPVQDLFQLQDALTHAIVSSLHVPLAAREHHARRKDVPINAAAYELYLRGNQLMNDSAHWAEGRKLYEQALELDPGYAPAWARLGRMLRVMAKYSGTAAEGERLKAERAFERALALNPDLSMAHHFYAHLEVETGRATDAMVRLVTRARARGNDPELFAGLVTTCRYCGLLDESVAAFEAAQRLDPSVQTSVAYTFYVRGEFQRVIDTDIGNPPYAALLARYRLDREGARAAFRETERLAMHEGVRLIALMYLLAMEGDLEALQPKLHEVRASSFADPEGFYLLATHLSKAGAYDEAVEILEQSVRNGYTCPAAIRSDSYWDPVRDRPAFVRALTHAEAASARARVAFEQAGGAAVVMAGVTP
jgi:serine/threonine protein kinase/tetratricopeptide (TPR) repeat protein